jgi:hypothetical protein
VPQPTTLLFASFIKTISLQKPFYEEKELLLYENQVGDRQGT